MENELLTVQEVAERLRLEPTTVRRKISSGELQAVRLGASDRSSLRVPLASLNAYLGEHVVSPTKLAFMSVS